jgi:hypothetical protein
MGSGRAYSEVHSGAKGILERLTAPRLDSPSWFAWSLVGCRARRVFPTPPSISQRARNLFGALVPVFLDAQLGDMGRRKSTSALLGDADGNLYLASWGSRSELLTLDVLETHPWLALLVVGLAWQWCLAKCLGLIFLWGLAVEVFAPRGTLFAPLPAHHTEDECLRIAQCTPPVVRYPHLRYLSGLALAGNLVLSFGWLSHHTPFEHAWFLTSCAILCAVQVWHVPALELPWGVFDGLSFLHGASEHALAHKVLGGSATSPLMVALASTYAWLAYVSRAQGPCAQFLRVSFAFVEGAHTTLALALLVAPTTTALSPGMYPHLALHVAVDLAVAFGLLSPHQASEPIAMTIFLTTAARAHAQLAG